jgi:UDP-N-acetylglucosamine 2-epimerase (non-hydrolysing)
LVRAGEAIKLAPLLKAMRGQVAATVCATGQQPGLVAQACATFGIEPDIVLPDKELDTPLNALLVRLVEDIDAAAAEVRPDWIVVQGDSTSALAGGLAAFGRGLRLAHVEAGLRTGDPAEPFPEETSRVLLARLATLNFAPTRVAQQNLLHEGVRPETVIVTGNTIVDAIALARLGLTRERKLRLNRSLPLDIRPVVLFTCHRRETRGEAFIDMCLVLQQLCESYPRHHWLFPVFPDAELHEISRRVLAGTANLTMMAPLSYPEMLHILERAVLVVTDSGQLQEEAPSFAAPTVIIREHTERPESIGAGTATLAGRNPISILRAVAEWLDNPDRKEGLERRNPYGDGGASHRIVTAMLRHGRQGTTTAAVR